MSDRESTTPVAANGDGASTHAARRAGVDPLMQVRNADLEPYVGLRYLSKLFRLIAVVLILLLVAEVVTGLARQGADAIPTLVSEASRLIVLAGLLWGIGDLAILLVDVGHDLRAVRILIGRQTAHVVATPAAVAAGPAARATTHDAPGAPESMRLEPRVD
jgi:hypothetical protein